MPHQRRAHGDVIFDKIDDPDDAPAAAHVPGRRKLEDGVDPLARGLGAGLR